MFYKKDKDKIMKKMKLLCLTLMHGISCAMIIERNISFDVIPQEIVSNQVMIYLPIKDLVSLVSTSKQMLNLFDVKAHRDIESKLVVNNRGLSVLRLCFHEPLLSQYSQQNSIGAIAHIIYRETPEQKNIRKRIQAIFGYKEDNYSTIQKTYCGIPSESCDINKALQALVLLRDGTGLSFLNSNTRLKTFLRIAREKNPQFDINPNIRLNSAQMFPLIAHAVLNDKLEIIKKLAQEDISLDTFDNIKQQKRSLLCMAINSHVEDVIQWLTEQEININQQDLDGRTPLICAVETGNKEIVKLVLRKNPDLTIKDRNNMTVLCAATNTNSIGLVSYLLETVFFDQDDLKNARQLASSYYNTDIYNLLSQYVGIKDQSYGRAFKKRRLQ